MKRLVLILTCFYLSMMLAIAQDKSVSGTVVDESGDPVIGASVIATGTTVGTVTDVEGKFSLSVPASSKTLLVRYIGMKDQEVAVAANLRIVLQAQTTDLDEVLVVAYGTAKKSAFTGSATQISGETLMKKNQTEITKSLAGEVAGLQVINTSGQPGSNAVVRIRGFGSANSSRAPLYVVDGIPFDGDISSIDASDIESTTVLKDASASALYGARAANGVILITTKKGEKGHSKIEVDIKTGVNIRLIPLYEVIDSPERFSELSWEGLRNYGALTNGLSPVAAGIYASNNLYDVARGIPSNYNMWDTNPNEVIDPLTGRFSGAARKYTPEKWSDYMFNTGNKTEASLRFSGGSDKLTHYTSFGTIDEKGYYIGSDFSRLNIRSNVNYQPREWLKAVTNLAYSYMETENPYQTDNMTNGFQYVNNMPPIFPVFQRDAMGNKIQDPLVGGYRYDYGMQPGYERPYASGINPVGTVDLDIQRQISHQLTGNANFEVTFMDGLKFSSTNGYQYVNIAATELTNPYYGDAEGIGRISREHISILGLTNTQMLSYVKNFSDHTFNAFIAHESSKLIINDDYAEKYNLAKADNIEFNNAINMQTIAGYSLDRTIESYFAQLKYDYREKYFADLNFRRDGSSRFTNEKWGNFFSGGAAWVVSKEGFMEDLEDINHFRLKASYGTYGNEGLNLGSDAANYYPTQNLYSIRNLNDQITYSLYYIGNPNLTWENSNMFNTGFDLGLWDDRLKAEVDFFHKKTTDMIFSKQVSPSLGYAAAPVNDAILVNRGVEFNLKGEVVKTSDWEVTLALNGSHYTNEMKKMPLEGSEEKNFELHSPYGWSKGHSIFDFYMREYAGVDPNTGQSQWLVYYDKNNPVLDANGDPTGKNTIVNNMADYIAKREAEGKSVDLEEQKTTTYSEATLKYVNKSAIPDLSGAFNIGTKYKGIELNVQVIYSIGGYGYDYVYAGLMGNNAIGTMNWHKDIEQRWTAPGQITEVPRLSATHDTYVNAMSSRFLTSRSYLGLNNVRLSYTFSKRLMEKIKLQKVSIWVSGDNVYLSTARKGYFPIGNEAGESDRSQYIPLTTVMGGINVQF